MKTLLYLFILIGSFSCKKESTNVINTNAKIGLVKYATGFDIIDYKTHYKLILKDPDSKTSSSIIFVKKAAKYAGKSNKQIFYAAISKIVVTSTTHIPMLELLNKEESLVGFPNGKYISSKKTRKLIDNGQVKELGKEQSINTELLLDLHPELVVGFSLSTNKKMYANIQKAGIPVLINNDWLEKTPLGRAEWIKFFGVLFGETEKANRIFNQIEREYLQAKQIALQANDKPKTLSGAMYQGKWNLPAGESFGAKFLKDANVNYIWGDSKGTGSLLLSLESVIDKGQDATIWLQPSFYTSYKQMKDANMHYVQFDAFQNKNIYNFTHNKGVTGGVIYYELAPIQPHIVLKDIIKAAHPELLPNYVPFYLEELR